MKNGTTVLIGVLVTALAIAYFVSMGWAVKGHFLSTGSLPAGMRATTVMTALAFAWFLEGRWQVVAGRAWVAPWAETAGSACTMAALALFWWAIAATRTSRPTVAFSPDPPSFLLTSGPYAWIRHPFYTSYVVFWAAAALEAPSPIFWSVPIALACLYATVARMEEVKFASSALAQEYGQYRSRTGMMLPALRRSGQRSGD